MKNEWHPIENEKKKTYLKVISVQLPIDTEKKKVSWFFNAITASRCADGILCSNNFQKYLACHAKLYKYIGLMQL